MHRASPVVGAVDLGVLPTPEADRVAATMVDLAPRAGVDPSTLFVATHRVVGQGGIHTALSVTGAGVPAWQVWRMCAAVMRDHPAFGATVSRHALGGPDAQAVARAATEERLLRIGGRCVRFPGLEFVAGTMTVAEILHLTAVEAVAEIGGTALHPGALVVTGGHLRPRWEFGSLTLHVQEEDHGVHLPFESAPVVNR